MVEDPGTQPPAPGRATALTAVVLATVVGGLIRLHRLGENSLWFDEIREVLVASRDLASLLEGVRGHLSPPLDYLAVKAAMTWLGSSDLSVRIPAWLFGTAAIPAFYHLTARVAGRRCGLVACALLAAAPMAVAHAQEARMYSLYLLLSIGSLIACERLRRDSGVAFHLAWGVSAGLLLLTHYCGLLLVGLQVVALWLTPATSLSLPRRLARPLPGLAICTLLFVPWLPSFLDQASSAGWQLSYGLPPTLYLPRSILAHWTTNTDRKDVWLFIFIALCAVGMVQALRQRHDALRLWGAGMAALMTLWLLVSIWRPVVTPRASSGLLPLYLALAAYGLCALCRRARAEFVALLGASLLAIPLHFQLTAPPPDYRPPWKQAARQLAPQLAPGDHLIVESRLARLCLGYYLTPEAPYVLRTGSATPTNNQPEWLIWIDQPDLPAAVAAGQVRGWLVWSSPLESSAEPSGFRDRFAGAAGQVLARLATQQSVLELRRLQVPAGPVAQP